MNHEYYDIDFVITWVDGNDPKWRKEYRKYKDVDEEDFDVRFRDWETLKYWFRGVEKYAPWVRKIHFITWGHLPEWLDTTNPKLHIVKHEDYIPEKFLPTFNSSVLELFFNNIEDLSEHFVYFNDDLFIINDVNKDYFFINGKPKDILCFEPICAYSYPLWGYFKLNSSRILSKHFDKRSLLKSRPLDYFSLKYPLKYWLYNIVECAFPSFTSFIIPHNPSPLLKSTYDEVWKKEREELELSASNRHRSIFDITQMLFRNWTLLKGNFVPSNPYKKFRYYVLGKDNQKIINTIKGNRIKTICINDDSAVKKNDFNSTKQMLLSAFSKKFPEKCSFEKN